MPENTNKPLFDRIPVWIVYIVGGVSGFVAGRAFTAAGIVAVTSSRAVAIVAVCGVILLMLFFFFRKKFAGFANVCLWIALCCAGTIR